MLKVNQERLWESLMEMGRVGGLPNGGCRRLALTDEDKAGRDLFVTWCRQSGCEVEIDQIGNIFARRWGTNPELPAVATGSHLDTQPHGGKFDGIYGVLAGLEVIRSLDDAGIQTGAPIDVIVWTNEEGARFTPPLTGSSTFVGTFDIDDIHQVTTHDGVLVRDELERIAYLGDLVPGDRDLDSFFEAHIEQGPVLEANGLTVGVVTGIQGIRWFSVEVEGVDSHAGTVPMDMRRDALSGAAQMVTRLREVAMQSHPDIRFTVGRFDVRPNSGSTIPGHVSFNIDLRHPDEDVLDGIESMIRQETHEIAASQQLGLKIDRTINAPPVIFNEAMVSLVRQAADRLGYGHMEMISGAGHDAMNLALIVPTTMIFVPCKDGISHNEAEFATPGDLAAGASVLLNAMLTRAGKSCSNDF
jgi:N-carbamoyl-L-amino-acid hydrolase